MSNSVRVVNELLVDLFNNILTIEKEALKTGKFNDLSLTEMHVIEAVGCTLKTMTDIADNLGVTVGTVTTSINRLLEKGYVTRNRSEEDRRFVEIQLTDKGKLAFRVHQAFHEEMVKYMIEGLDEKDNDVLIASLQRLSNFFKDKYHINHK
ncbi:MAG: MarR family transcriptional regulator [Epulopiscium sp. Nele67-Bin005]|nr:MAG: MarR family transcriptional regulator [Epulopiscium sp. Nele67-Bin005]